MRRGVSAVLVAALAAVVLAGPAMAAPRGDPFELACDSGGTIEAVVAGRGLWSPGVTVVGPSVFTPYRHQQTVTYDPDEGDPFLLESIDVQRNSPPGGLVASIGDRCTYESTIYVTAEMAEANQLPGPGVWRLDGVVWGLWVR